MKRLIHRVQDVRQKAGQIASALEQAPAKAAELRERVLATAGHMHQMQRTVQDAATGLAAPHEDMLIAALHEIDGDAETFRAAGYELEDVEMELAAPQRLIIHLEKVGDVLASTMRSLAAAKAHHPTTHGILSALLKADDMSEKVALQNLRYHQLTVYMGPAPTVRLCWQASSIAAPPPLPAGSPAVAAAPGSSAFTSLLGQSSFFEARPGQASPPAGDPVSPDVPAPESAPETASTPAPPADPPAKEDPLARFKKMPDLSRRR